MPSVVSDSRVPVGLGAGSTIATDATAEQDRHDLLEALRRCGQQQRGSNRAADRGDRERSA